MSRCGLCTPETFNSLVWAGVYFYTHLFVLVGGDCDKLSLGEAETADALFLRVGSYFYQMQAGLVLVEGVQHDLKTKKNKTEFIWNKKKTLKGKSL